jgi:hypothetical protein
MSHGWNAVSWTALQEVTADLDTPGSMIRGPCFKGHPGKFNMAGFYDFSETFMQDVDWQYKVFNL